MDLAQLAIGVAGGVVVTVLAFVLALRQDHARFTREKRADLYIDLLAEASSELDWLLTQFTEIEMGRVVSPKSPDDRLKSSERRKLGARMAAFGGAEVVRRFNVLGQTGFPVFMVTPDDAPRLKLRAGLAFDALEAQIRRELRADRGWWQRLRNRAL